jgi:hypothetical protein
VWRSKQTVAIIFFSLLVGFTGFSQNKEQARWDSTIRAKNYRNIVKISPFHVFDFYPSLQIAYERRLTKKFSLQTDIGFVAENSRYNLLYQNIRGVKLNLEGRFYLSHGSYFGMEAYTTAVDFRRQASITGCFDLACQMQYTQTYNYNVKYRESGFSWKFGHILGLFDRDHIIMDVSYGFDLRFINYIKPIDDTNNNTAIAFRPIFSKDEDKRREFSPAVGIRLGYRFR